MDSFRTRLSAGIFGDQATSLDWQSLPIVTVKTVERSEYETARRSLSCGELIVTCECPSLAVADFIRNVEVMTGGVFIGKLHLRFYSELKKVKRNFVTHDPQVRKLLGLKRERMSLPMVNWLGDTSEEVVRMIAKDAIHEVELLCTEQPTRAVKGRAAQSHASMVAKTVPNVHKAEKPVVFQSMQSPEASSATPAAVSAVQRESVNREAKGVRTVGVVAEMGRTHRPSQNGGFTSFCLKIDANGVHIPLYGVELERECAERGVKAGMRVEVIQMGKQAIGDGRHKNLFKINILG